MDMGLQNQRNALKYLCSLCFLLFPFASFPRATSAKPDKNLLSCLADKAVLSVIGNMSSKADDQGYSIRIPNQMGRVLQGYRKHKGLTRAEVGRAVGLQQSGVSELEFDPSTASLNRIFKLLAALDLELVIRPRGARRSISDW
jgi:HTH-type transcriptional regulator/antitoxin HipB